MRASILAILILGGIVLNIKAQFSYNPKIRKQSQWQSQLQ